MAKSVEKITKIKRAINESNASVDWDYFFESVIHKVANQEDIPISDVITLEHAPESFAGYIIQIAEILAKQRTESNPEKLRVCQSIYGFTTCLTPCAYGSYGSCLFATREGEDVSFAAKLFGNLTTADEFVGALKDCNYSNNRKLISTSHKPTDDVLKIILETIERVRADSDVESLPICVSLGSVDEEQIIQLKNAGATRVNHNLETSYYNAIYLSAISQNKDDDRIFENEYFKRLTTLLTSLKNQISFCSGGMLFYGDDETVEDRILLYITLRELDKIYDINSSPFNVYVPLREIVDESLGWFNSFKLPAVERKKTIHKFRILKTLVSFALIVPLEHKITISAGSKWLEEYYPLAVELGGGAGLANYLQQVPVEDTIKTVDRIREQIGDNKHGVKSHIKENSFSDKLHSYA